MAKRLCGRGFQVIVNVLKKSEKEALEPYFRAGIKKKSLFFLETSLGEYFALLGLNNYFFRNVIGGAVAGDTGALHAAQAANSRLSGFLRPAVICLGHGRTSGDIRYADPGITYLARLKSGWDRRLEKAAADKMKLFRRKEFSKFIGMPIRYVSVDEPAKNPYLVRGVPARPDVLPVFIGRQVYCHTLLRNIFKDEIRPLAAAERKRFYRRMDVKKIGPEFVARLFEEMESQKAEEAAKNAPKAGAVMTAEGKDETRRLETTYRALLFLEKSGSRMFPRPAYFSGFGDRDVLVSSRLGGGRLLDSWKSMNRAGKMRILKQVMEQLKIIHKIKFGNFGKFGINSSLLFASWEDYIKSCINQRLVEIKRKRRLDSGDLFRLKEFVRRNSAFLRSSGASLVHHDIKADNILVSRGKLSGLIDFEYSTAAPIDYEADTLLRSFADPEIYFGRRGKFLKSDAELVWKAARRYYPEIFDFRGIGARLKMYNIKFYLDLLARGKRPGHCRLKLEEQLSGKGILKNPG